LIFEKRFERLLYRIQTDKQGQFHLINTIIIYSWICNWEVAG
jgi:hypothetical protein